MSDEFEINGLQITMEELFFFVKEQYPEVINKMQTVDINYIGVLDYLANNQEIPYSNPEVPGLAQDEKERLLKVKEKGQAAVAEIKRWQHAVPNCMVLISVCQLHGLMDRIRKQESISVRS